MRNHSLFVSLIALAVGMTVSPGSAKSQETVAEQPASPCGIPEWNVGSPDFEADLAVVFGRLPNGMRYAIRRNTTPPGEAVIRFNVQVGGRDETDAEHGAAHFVEHMAFNGSTNIPEGELLPMLERLGLAFGADTNAETSLDYTTYKLGLPNTDEETVNTAFMVMREMAGNLTFDPAAVERERGVILREAQDRNDANRRRAADYLRTALPGTPLGERITADAERIREISARDLRGFYQAYYRPDRATLVVVGDIDPVVIEAKIEELFADWQGEGEPRALYAAADINPSAPAFSNFVDPATPEIVEIQTIEEWSPSDNTVASARDEVLRAIAGAVIANRINELSRSADSPTLGGQVTEQPLFRTAIAYGLLIVAKDGQWQPTLELAERELRRAARYGFAQSEVDEIKAGVETALRNAAAQADGRDSVSLADALITASLTDAVVTTPEVDLAFYQQIAPTITAETTSEAFAKAFEDGPDIVHLSTKIPVEGGTQAIAAVLAASAQVAVTPPEEAETVAFAYTDWGEPGTIVADERIEDLGIRTIRFANGLQLNLKRTGFEPGKINFTMRVGSGSSAFPSDVPGLALMLPIFATIDGFEAHGPDELRRALAGRQIELTLSANNAGLVSEGATTPDDLLLQMQLLAARLTATGYREETRGQLVGVVPLLVENLRAAPIQVWSNAFNAVLSGGDARLGVADPVSLGNLSLDDLRQAIEPQLAQGSVALGLVGDFDEDAAIEAVAATLGTLPARPSRVEVGKPPRAVAFTGEAGPIVLTHAGQDDQGVLSLSWPSDDGQDLPDDLARDVLASVFNLRMTEILREELSAAYSPQAFSFSTTTYDGFGHITALVTTPAEDMDRIAEIIEEIAGGLTSEPVSADLLERARSPIREGFERAENINSAWTGLVAMAQSDPEELDRRRQRLDALNALTPQTLQRVAAQYLRAGQARQIRVVPE
ncbi:insulinase family protein [Aurantiacibacter aquimixticola]|uniref:Insulinase family protein n=2 Tax=Aurantiacibacter aquimixticola TaxID=1958945 RepID=A0A419RNI0_9SPHN|nr:insulinase family protein [Aurantiacibacter aquimixticola]